MIATFGAVFVALYVAHVVADYWVQTPHQAADKGGPGWPGRVACAGHVASYTLTAAVVLAVVAWRLDLDVSVPRVVAGLAVSAVSHYWADRRSTLRALVAVLDRPGVMPGKGAYFDAGGAAHLDQAWHIAWLLVATLVIV
jgi:Protein of unknown function (DUF3307)